MNTSDNRAGTTADEPSKGQAGQAFKHLKDDVSETLGGARQQADAQFGQYRDTAAEQIEALAQGAKSFVSELEDKDTLGMSDYLTDMADRAAFNEVYQRFFAKPWPVRAAVGVAALAVEGMRVEVTAMAAKA